MPAEGPSADRPNIVLILADDMGFSDIGCYGSEIRTPNLDRLAHSGVRFSQMYNAARCCPSRASMLTGLQPHQAGVGHMVADWQIEGYRGFLSTHCVTIAEALAEAGYRTHLSGKWHVGGDYPLQKPDSWVPGDATHPLPTQRGFQHFFGTLTGAGNFYNPPTLAEGDSLAQPESDDFFYTDAISDHAVQMIRESVVEERPFFSFVSYTAPHWPLHAHGEDIAKYESQYLMGWDELKARRHEELIGLGILQGKWSISPRDEDVRSWKSADDKDWEALRMAVYAAQIDRMDQGVGRIVSALSEVGLRDNTIVMFLSDNGGCAEFLAEDSGTPNPVQFDTPLLDGSRARMGNIPGLRPGPADTFQSYDIAWAHASNSPFRRFKHWLHEGGISTPFIVNWPSKINAAAIVHEPAYLPDIMTTCLDAAAVPYPKERDGNAVTPIEGESLLPLVTGGSWQRERPICWEHEGNAAVRLGQWKLVREFPGDWELYDMEEDRTELNDLASKEPQRVKQLAALWAEWAERVGVKPWPVVPQTTAKAARGRHIHVVR
jgi:arylsulfatase A-like enzyme